MHFRLELAALQDTGPLLSSVSVLEIRKVASVPIRNYGGASSA